MKTAGELVRFVGNRPFGVLRPEQSVAEAIALMEEIDSGAILVMEGEMVVGIFSERDYARKILLQGKSSLTTSVAEVMSTRVYYVSPEYTPEQCLAIMTSLKIRNLPVMENGKIFGLLTMSELASHLIRNRDMVIGELLKYITGSNDNWLGLDSAALSPLEPLTLS